MSALHIGIDPETTEAITLMVKKALREAHDGQGVDVDKVKADALEVLLAGVTFTPPPETGPNAVCGEPRAGPR